MTQTRLKIKNRLFCIGLNSVQCWCPHYQSHHLYPPALHPDQSSCSFCQSEWKAAGSPLIDYTCPTSISTTGVGNQKACLADFFVLNYCLDYWFIVVKYQSVVVVLLIFRLCCTCLLQINMWKRKPLHKNRNVNVIYWSHFLFQFLHIG